MSKPLYEQHVDSGGYIYLKKNETSGDSTNIVFHAHNAVEFKFIVSGNYQIEVGDEKHICKGGTIVFVDSCRPHAYKSLDSAVHFVLVIGKEFIDIVCGKGNAFPLLMVGNNHFQTDILPILENTFLRWGEMTDREKRGFVYRLIGTIMQYYNLVKAQYTIKEPFITEILKYIEEHFNEDISLESLSKKFGYSKNYFSNLFNTHIKMGLREYVNRYRIRKALMLQKEKEKMPLWRIAEHCGYTSMNTFRRALNRYADETINENS